jgi:hypothetical protein
VHPHFPLRGLKFKNTTSQNLLGGPVTVYAGGAYAGDSRLPDLQPDEERLLSYAVDQGVEIKAERRAGEERLTALTLRDGLLLPRLKQRDAMVYLIRNRSRRARTLIVEQPIRQEWDLGEREKPAERSRDLYRFEWQVPAGKTARRQVVEERTRTPKWLLTKTSDEELRQLIAGPVGSRAVKDALGKVQQQRARVAAVERELARLLEGLKAITEDQARLRANIGKVPLASAAYKRYLAKFDKQETAIENLQEEIVAKQAAARRQEREYHEFLEKLTAK